MTLMTDAVAHAPARESVYRPRHPLHLGRTVGMLRRGGTDPTMVIDGARIWMTFRTDAGIATLCLRQNSDGIHASAWGPGAGEALDVVPRLCGADDDDSGFIIGHPQLEEVARAGAAGEAGAAGRSFSRDWARFARLCREVRRPWIESTSSIRRCATANSRRASR